MNLISKIFGLKGSQKSSDPIIDCCLSIAQRHQLTLTDEEWNHVLCYQDKLAGSPFGGKYVHEDIFHALCFLCLFDGLFQAGLEFLHINNIKDAKISLEKAKRILPWPTVLFSLGLAYARSGEVDPATKIWNKAIEDFESRPSFLSAIVASTLPDRSDFIAIMTERIDNTGSVSLGFTNMTELKVRISEKIQELKK
jgi:tetratricopeptide (TPR) repeat protein